MAVNIADIERATAAVAALVLVDEGFAPVFDRLVDELEKARDGQSSKERARAFLSSR